MSGLLWLLIWGGLFYFMMRWGCGAHAVHGHGGHGGDGGHGGHGGDAGHDPAGHAHAGHPEQAAERYRDPVCDMTVDAGTGYSRTYNGRDYRFCSERCRDQFDADPARYAA